MALKILLSTTVVWPAPARLAGAFAACGAQVEALAPRRHPVGESLYLSKLHPYRPLQGPASLSAAIESAKPDLIIPCDDRALRHMLTLAAQAPRHAAVIGRSLGHWGGYGRLLSRVEFLSIAHGLGITVPTTRAVANEAELKEALHATGLPAVLKSDGSWGGEGVTCIRNWDEAVAAFERVALAPSRLRSLVRAARRKDAHFLLQAREPQAAALSVQSFVEGMPATCAFAAWEGSVVAELQMDVDATRDETGPATVLRRCTSPQMTLAAERIAAHFRLSGLHGLDFMRDRDGMLHLIEINPRATQICHLALGETHDLPAALLGAAQGSAAPARPAVTSDEVIALFPQSLPQGGTRLAGAYHDLPLDDPKVMHALSTLVQDHAQPLTQNA